MQLPEPHRQLKVLTVVGTRPEAIKLAPVVYALKRCGPLVEAQLCATAQHREMLDQVLAIFALRPDYDLNVMREGQRLDWSTSALLTGVAKVLRTDRPDVVLVVGDTTTGFAASLAAFYEQIPVGHVEAGLRTGKRYSPFPEEILRKLITQVAVFHFAPTRRAAENLAREVLYEDAEVYQTGNPVVDAVKWMVDHRGEAAHAFARRAQRMLLVTAHRRENFGEPLRRICSALLAIVERNEDVEVVYPVHQNPNVRGPVRDLLGGQQRVHLIPPQDYAHFAYLMADSFLILTDSGGIQEEAPVFGKPVLVMREETERPEAIEAGTAVLVGTSEQLIVETAERLLRDESYYASLAHAESPFGDGHAAERIAGVLLQRFCAVGDAADRYRVRLAPA